MIQITIMPVVTRSQYKYNMDNSMLTEQLISIRKEIMSENNAGNMIIIFQDEKLFEKYRNTNAQYDDEYYRIPYDIFYKTLNINRTEINDLIHNIESSYDGDIWLDNNEIVFYGGA